MAGFVHVLGAREHNLKDVDVDIPRDARVVFAGTSGSGKSSLALRRYLESVSPYARRLFHQMGVLDVREIDGLPPAVALQQQRGSPTTRTSVGSVTTLSKGADALFARRHLSTRPAAPRRRGVLAEHARGRVPRGHGLGRVYEVTERSMRPDDSLTIRERHRGLAARVARRQSAGWRPDHRARWHARFLE